MTFVTKNLLSCIVGFIFVLGSSTALFGIMFWLKNSITEHDLGLFGWTSSFGLQYCSDKSVSMTSNLNGAVETKPNWYEVNELPYEYQSCLDTMVQQADQKSSKYICHQTCYLPSNTQITIINNIKNGHSGNIWSVKVKTSTGKNRYNNFDKIEWVMKFSRIDCDDVWQGYLVMRGIYDQIPSNVSKLIKAPKIHPDIPFYGWNHVEKIDNDSKRSESQNGFRLKYGDGYMYEIEQRCLIVMEKLADSIQLYKMRDKLTKNNVFGFLNNCYQTMMQSHWYIYKYLHLFDNDISSVDTLVNKNNFDCYIIDFGSTLQLTSTIKIGNVTKNESHFFQMWLTILQNKKNKIVKNIQTINNNNNSNNQLQTKQNEMMIIEQSNLNKNDKIILSEEYLQYVRKKARKNILFRCGSYKCSPESFWSIGNKEKRKRFKLHFIHKILNIKSNLRNINSNLGQTKSHIGRMKKDKQREIQPQTLSDILNSSYLLTEKIMNEAQEYKRFDRNYWFTVNDTFDNLYIYEMEKIALRNLQYATIDVLFIRVFNPIFQSYVIDVLPKYLKINNVEYFKHLQLDKDVNNDINININQTNNYLLNYAIRIWILHKTIDNVNLFVKKSWCLQHELLSILTIFRNIKLKQINNENEQEKFFWHLLQKIHKKDVNYIDDHVCTSTIKMDQALSCATGSELDLM